MTALCPTCKNYQSKLCDSCVHNVPKLLTVVKPVLAISDRKHDAWDALKEALAAVEKERPNA